MPADEINQGEYNGTRKNAWKIITKTEATPQLNLTWPSNQFAEASLNTVKELKQISMHHVNLSNEFAIVPKNSAAKKTMFWFFKQISAHWLLFLSWNATFLPSNTSR